MLIFLFLLLFKLRLDLELVLFFFVGLEGFLYFIVNFVVMFFELYFFGFLRYFCIKFVWKYEFLNFFLIVL